MKSRSSKGIYASQFVETPPLDVYLKKRHEMLSDEDDGANTGDNTPEGRNGLAKSFDASARPILTVDVRKYQSLIDDPNLSEAQKEEFLRALWSVVVTFVELGFSVHPLQEVCGQDSGILSVSPKGAFDQVKSNDLNETQDDEEPGPTVGVEKHEYTPHT